MWIFLGTFFGVLFLILVIALISEIKLRLEIKSESNKLARYYKDEGKKDITLLETFMRENSISFPAEKNRDDEYFYSCLRNVKEHFRHKIVYQNLQKAGFSKSNSFSLDNCGEIFYNQKSVLIFHELFEFLVFIYPKFHNELVKYHYGDSYRKDHYLSLDGVFRYLEKLKNPDFYKEFATIIPKNEIYWCVNDGASAGYQLVETGSGAIVGGLLLGPVGAMLGAASGNKKIKELEKEKTIIFGEKSKQYWIVSDSEFTFDRIFELLNKHFPNHRLSSSYAKHL